MTKYKSTNREGRICKGIKLTIRITVSQEVEKERKMDNAENDQYLNFHNRMSKYTLKF